MGGSAPRLGYYLIALGIVLQSLGLSSDAWFNTAEASNGAMLSFTSPGDVLLGLGMAVILAGTLVGLVGRAPESISDFRPAVLAPVLLAVLSIGSMAFAYQVGGFDSSNVPGSPSVASAQECPEGTYYMPEMGHCMINGTTAATPIDDGNGTGTPTCPEGYYWMPAMNHCMQNGTIAATPIDDGNGTGTPTCPEGFYWMPAMNHCMANGTTAVTPVATDDGTGNPVCPDGYYWMPSMNHCMSLVTATPLPPGATPPQCPAGTVWHPAMGECMSTVCPSGYTWNGATFTCQPNGTPPPPTATPTPTPVCPPGTYWMPSMNHCMPGTPPPPTPTPTATPSCPDGYIWMPSMGHCMSTTCPPPWVFNWDTLFCELPGPTISIVSPAEGANADTDLTVDVEVTGATLSLISQEGAHWQMKIDGVAQPLPFDETSVSVGPLAQGPHTIDVALYENAADSVLVDSDEVSFIALDEPTLCLPGQVWSPDEQHCELTTCPPPWVFDWASLHCDLPAIPTETPTPTPDPTSCPAGYIWMPAMGHCMSTSCPAPLVFNWDTLYCELPSGTPTPPPTPTPDPTPTPAPSCPDGYIWMPAMGHCMSTTCPPPWVFNWDTLYCELPPDLLSGATLSAVLPPAERHMAVYFLV